MSFNKNYYNKNKQDNNRIGLLFYSNVIQHYYKQSTILDYGCGTGHLLNRLSKKKFINKSYGFEISNYARKKSEKNSKKSLIIDNLDKIKDKSINLITALHVIEHIDVLELSKTIESFKRILNAEGYILIATPAKNGIGHRIKKEKWIGYSDKTHINIKSFNEWISFFNKNNLKLIKASSDGLWDFPYKLKNNKLLILKIIMIMIFQIVTGKLYLSYDEGETFIFLLKFN